MNRIYVGFITTIFSKSLCIKSRAVDILNGLPTDKTEILLVAHNSDYDCRFILKHLQNKKPIVKK